MRKPLVAIAALAFALLVTSGPRTALANDDAAACTPDVLRLCSSDIPWRERIVACLAANKRKLSPPCFKVFSRKPAKPGKPGRDNTQPTVARFEPGMLQ
jgi:hypothetical protein